MDGSVYIFYITTVNCVLQSSQLLSLGVLLVIGRYKENQLLIFVNVCPFDYSAFVIYGMIGILNWILTHKSDDNSYSNWPSRVGPQSF